MITIHVSQAASSWCDICAHIAALPPLAFRQPAFRMSHPVSDDVREEQNSTAVGIESYIYKLVADIHHCTTVSKINHCTTKSRDWPNSLLFFSALVQRYRRVYFITYAMRKLDINIQPTYYMPW